MVSLIASFHAADAALCTDNRADCGHHMLRKLRSCRRCRTSCHPACMRPACVHTWVVVVGLRSHGSSRRARVAVAVAVAAHHRQGTPRVRLRCAVTPKHRVHDQRECMRSGTEMRLRRAHSWPANALFAQSTAAPGRCGTRRTRRRPGARCESSRHRDAATIRT